MTETQKPPAVTFRGVTYRVQERETTAQMRERGLHRTAPDFEARGIFATLLLVRRNGRINFLGFEDAKGEIFSVDRLPW